MQQIYDPFTGDMATGTGRTQFPNNVIPADRVSAISRQLLALYPLPNVEGTGAGGLTANYRLERPSSTDRHNFDLKVNWNRTPEHQLWGKYSHMNALVDDLFTFPLPTVDGDGGETKVHLITGGQTWTVGKSLLVDSSIGVSIMDQFCSSPDFALGMMGLNLGIPGTNDQGRGDPRYAGMPQFSTGFQAIGNTPTWSPAYRDEGSVSFSTNVTKVVGSHDFRAGYRVDYLTLDNWQPERANPRGSFSFAGNATRTFGTGVQTANFYNTYAAFMLGLINTATKSYQYELFTGREWQHAMFFRDRWTVKQKLTLDLGLRWEYYPIMTRADRQIELMDRQTLDVLIGGVGGNPKNMGLVAPKDGFTPRIGAVYRLDEKTVLRSGYGATLDARGMSAQEAFRGDFSYPLVLNASFPPPAGTSTFGWYGTARAGDSAPRGAGSEHRPHAVAELVRHADLRAGVYPPRPHAFVERLARTAPAAERVGRCRLRGQQTGRWPAAGETQTININNVQHLGGGDTDRPYFRSHGRQLDIEIYSPWRRTSYHALQVGITRPFTQGLLLKGHYTFSRSRALRTDYEVPDPAIQERNWALANGDRPHTFQMAFVYQLPWRSEERQGSIAQAAHQRLAGQRHPRGVQRLAVHRHRRRDDVEYAGQLADGRPRGHGDEDRRDWRGRLLLRPGRVGAAGRRSLRNRAGQSVPRPRRLEPRPLGLPFVPARAGRIDSRPESKRPTSRIRRSSPTRRAICRTAISCASSACTARMRNGRSGSRFGTASNRRSEDPTGGPEVRRSGENTVKLLTPSS